MDRSGGVVHPIVDQGHIDGPAGSSQYHAEESIGDSVYKLLIKNVSKNQPLTAEEAQELKAFRSTLSTEQWQGWLQFARDEKQKMRAKRVSPPKPSILTKDPEQLLRAILKTEGTASHLDIAPIDDNPRKQNVPSPAQEPIVVPEFPSAEDDIVYRQVSIVQKSKRLIADEGTASTPLARSSVERSAWELGPQQQIDVGDARRLVLESQESVGAAVATAAAKAGPGASWVAPQHHLERSHYPQHEGSAQLTRDQEGGVSLELGMIRRSSRGRASSAPRDRPAPSVSFGANSQQHPAYTREYSGMSLSALKKSPAHSPKLKHSRTEDFFGGSTRAGAQSPTRTHHQHEHHHHSHRSSNLSGTPAGPYSSRVGRQQQYQQVESHLIHSLDLADAAEIARSTAFRLDSAYSAAQCLLSTFAADQKEAYLSNGGDYNRHLQHEPRAEQDKASAALSILSEMMSSMEKSKEALAQLSNLHMHQHQAGRDPRHSPESTRKRDGDTYRSSGRHPREQMGSVQHRWTSPTAASRNQHKLVHRAPSVASEASNSPDGEEKRGERGEEEGFYDSSPFQALGREEELLTNQVLHFDDLEQVNRVKPPGHRFGGGEGSLLPGSGLRSIRNEPKWFPDSGAASLGASLNAQFAQERPSGDFSPWNRQVAASAAQEQTDPVNNLQAQLFDAAETSRKVADYSHTIGASPLPRAELLQNQQFSYNRAGYVWEGVRFNRAQGPVARLCIAQGVLIKAHDDYPIRVDAESGVVDVVWREARLGDAVAGESLLASSTRSNPSPIAKLLSSSEPKQNYFTDSSTGSKRNTVLRRERFSFDDIFSGLTAQGRLAFFTRQRARKALETSHNLIFLCLGCGDNAPAGGSAVEPPISVLLGGGGGTGLISSVVDEIFRFTKPLTTTMQESKGLYPGSFPTASPSGFVASKLAFEQVKSRVTLSAIILTEQGQVFDLLGGSADGAASLKRRKSDGRVMLCNASRLQLQASADFDRVMGLLLGKRTALHGVLQSLQQQQAQQLKMGIIPAEPLQNVLASIDPWASLNSPSSSSGSGHAEQHAQGGSASTSSMLITVSVSGGAVSSSQTSVDFNFVSPCGRNWSCPGSDINILAELVSSLPNTPPPSLLRASALGMLLMDPRNPPSDFINVVTVHRDDASKGAAAKTAARDGGPHVVQGALHSLRIIAQLTQ